MEPTDTILAVKQKIQTQANMPPHIRYLLFGGAPLADNHTLAECNVPADAVLMVSLDLRGDRGGDDRGLGTHT